MRKVITLLLMLSLFATGKMSAGWGYATCILPDKSQRTIEFRYEITSTSLNRIRIISATDDNKKSCVETNRNQEVIDQVGPYFEGCEIIFPSNDAGWTITSVGEHAFYHCKAKVTLPESVTEIEGLAFEFYNYDGYDFALPSKVRYIGKQAFRSSQIKGISLPSSLQNIDDAAFQYSKLEELVLPKSTFVVGSGITYGCNNLQRLEVESGCTNYSTPAGSNVIMDTKQKVVVAGCPTSKIPAEAYRIGNGAFGDIKFVNETVTIPESVGVIGEEAFYLSKFKRLIIKGETVEILYMAFTGCNMDRIDIYGGNVTIGESAFENCTDLFAVWCYSHKPKLDLKVPSYLEGYLGYRHFYNIGSDWEWGNSNVLLIAKYPEEYTDKNDSGDLVWKKWFKTPFGYTDNYDYMRISEVHLTDFDWPVAGSPCDVTATSLTTYATVSEVSYSMNGKTYDPSKAAGYNEQINVAFTITLGTAPHGQCEFTDDVKLYVDGKEADFYVTASGNTPTQKTFVFADYRVPAPPGGVPVRSVSITVPEPVEGQPLSTEVTNPTGKKYLAQGWTYSNVTWGKEADASLDSYDPTKAYTLAAIVTAKEDYCFGADCTFNLNGKEASVIRSHNTEGREVVMLAVAYGKEEPVVPDSIFITNVDIQTAEPVVGEPLSKEVVSPTEDELRMLDYEILDVVVYPENKAFNNDGLFNVIVTVTAKENCYFAEDVSVTLNGKKPISVIHSKKNDGVTPTIIFGITYNEEPSVKVLPGRFTVGEGKQVIFSQGNLQYRASDDTWRFAENQYGGQGEDNADISDTHTYFIDLLGWGTSGYNGKNPWMTSTTSTDYGDGTNDIAGTNYDWGVYNSESITNNAGLKWRTLTADEWYYLFYTRPNRGAGRATACNMHGYIILPDDWTLPEGLEFTKNAQTWDVNVYDADDWAKMEQAGAVFLPAAGQRYSATNYKDFGEWGHYWTSSAKNDNDAVSFYFAEYSFDADWSMGRENGYSVRLVSDVVRKRGDVTGEGDVNSADVVAIYAYIIEGDASGYTKEAADVDGSGEVNSADVVEVYNIIINGEGE
ncbi:MAG: leucine-rich repeat protein [Bacteroidaceae bacterium]|nr:leucine-rich repeat protein [Bacteroidaceae bacterium]